MNKLCSSALAKPNFSCSKYEKETRIVQEDWVLS